MYVATSDLAPMAGEGWEEDIPAISLPFRRLDLRAYGALLYT